MFFLFSKRILLLFSLLFVVFIACSGVYAQLSLDCDTVWKGPSADNDILKCVKNPELLKKNWRHLVLPALNIFLLACFLLTFPFVFCCALTVSCCAPTSKTSNKRARCCVWLWVFYVFLWAAVMFFLIFYGATLLIKTVPVILDSVSFGSLSYFNQTAEKIRDYASDWSTGKRRELEQFPLDFDGFAAVNEKAETILNTARSYYLKYLKMVSIATYCVSCIGFAFCLLFLPSAICRICVPCLPLLLSCLYWITGIIFAVLGVVVAILSIVATLGCGEVELHFKRQPGVLQWYGVPMCMERFNFEKLNEQIRTEQKKLCSKACGFLLQLCSGSTTNNITSLPSNILSGVPRRNRKKRDTQNIPSLFGNVKKLSDKILNGEISTDTLTNVLTNFGAQADVASSLSTVDLGELAGLAVEGGSEGFQGLPEGINIDSSKGLAEIAKEILSNPEKLGTMFPDIKDKLDLSTIKSLKDVMSKLSAPLTCGRNITKVEECADFGMMAAVLMDSKIKNSVLKPCPGTDKEYCSLSECSANCTIDFFRQVSKEILVKAELARNVSIALAYARPLLECNFIMEKFAAAFDSCADVRTGTLVLALGFFVGGLLFGVAIYIALRGACVWRSRKFKRQKAYFANPR